MLNPNNSGEEQRRREGIKPVLFNTQGDQTCEEEQRSGGVKEFKWWWHMGAQAIVA